LRLNVADCGIDMEVYDYNITPISSHILSCQML